MLGPVGAEYAGDTPCRQYDSSASESTCSCASSPVSASISERAPGASSGPFTADQAARASELNVEGATIVLPFVEPAHARRNLSARGARADHFRTRRLRTSADRSDGVWGAGDRERPRGPARSRWRCRRFIAVGDVPAWIAAIAQRVIRERIDDAARWSSAALRRIRTGGQIFIGASTRGATLELYRQVPHEARAIVHSNMSVSCRPFSRPDRGAHRCARIPWRLTW